MGSRATAMLLAALLAGLAGCQGIARGVLDEPEMMDWMKRRFLVELPQLGHVRLASGFHLVLDFLLAGREPMDADERAFAQATAVYVFGNTAGHDLLARMRTDERISGEGQVIYYAHRKETDAAGHNAVLDAIGNFTILVPGQDGPEAMSFTIQTSSQNVAIGPHRLSICSQIIPTSCSYGPMDHLTSLWKNTMYKLEMTEGKAAPGEAISPEFRTFLRSIRGPMWPVMRVEYRLHDLGQGRLAYSLVDRYPFYVRIPSVIISAAPEIQMAIERLKARMPDRFIDQGANLEVRLGYVFSSPISTDGTQSSLAEEEIGAVKAFRLLEDERR